LVFQKCQKGRRSHRKRKTKRIHEVGNAGEGTACSDRISYLPLEIIHVILCKIPTRDIAKTSVLSQGWRRVWASRPTIYLDELVFGANYFSYTERDIQKRDAFLTYLKKSLEIRKEYENNSAVDILFLQMTVENSSAESLVQKWIYFALENKAKALRLHLKTTYGLRFNLLDIAFFADTLLWLVIHDCEITNCSFMLPNLEVLFLSNVCIENDDLVDLIAGCPQIKYLSIDIYLDLERLSIVVSNPNLKFFRVHRPGFDSKIQIQSTNLKSLEFSSTCMDMCEIEITSTTTVRDLTLQNVYYDLCSKME
ncbi:F-box/FBD/LRR-repeat protein At5g44980-like, partial [Lycium barbarum]|uniref:F-box/FBD/LRR-repeat protein At5g44980-like n=1 Tax=Lycium barbarum TaxID=112863 RepID=UPI00293EDBBE